VGLRGCQLIARLEQCGVLSRRGTAWHGRQFSSSYARCNAGSATPSGPMRYHSRCARSIHGVCCSKSTQCTRVDWGSLVYLICSNDPSQEHDSAPAPSILGYTCRSINNARSANKSKIRRPMCRKPRNTDREPSTWSKKDHAMFLIRISPFSIRISGHV
jgi:hypothetical protein